MMLSGSMAKRAKRKAPIERQGAGPLSNQDMAGNSKNVGRPSRVTEGTAGFRRSPGVKIG